MNNSNLMIRIDPETKAKASELAKQMGLSVSGLVRLLIFRSEDFSLLKVKRGGKGKSASRTNYTTGGVTVISSIRGMMVEVGYSYHKGYRGMREGGLQLEPDEDAEITIDYITTLKGNHAIDPERLDKKVYRELLKEC